jgi:hypothetical protein
MAWGLGALALGALASVLHFSRNKQEPPPLYLAEQAKILRYFEKLDDQIPLNFAVRGEAEEMLNHIAQLPAFKVPPYIIKRLLDEFKICMKKKQYLSVIKEIFQDRQEDYINVLLSRQELYGAQSEQLTQVILGVFDRIDDRTHRASLVQLATWYDHMIHILQNSFSRDSYAKTLESFHTLGRNLDRIFPPSETSYGHGGWFMEPDELTRAFDRLFKNARSKSFHFHKDFHDLTYLFEKLEEETRLDSLLRSLGKILKQRLFDEVDSTFLVAVEGSLDWRQETKMEKGCFIDFLQRVAKQHPNEKLRSQAEGILNKFGISV